MTRVLIPTALAAPPACPRGRSVRRLDGDTMGTRWSVRYAGDADPHPLRGAIEAELDRVIAEMSSWRAESDLCRFNRLPAGSWVALPAGFQAVLGCALEVARTTGGAFDPTMGPLVDLWGFGPEPARGEGPPQPAEIAAARARVGWARIAFDAASGRARQPGGVALDLSGIAKGYAVDRVAECLTAAGIVSHLVEIGGELRGHGVKPDGTPWWVAVEQPAPGGEAMIAALHGLAIATSGDAHRSFVHDGRRYGHTLDPRTGCPIDPALASVTVLHAACMQADALATALSVLGPEAGMAHAARHGIAALMVTRGPEGGMREHLSPALRAMLD